MSRSSVLSTTPRNSMPFWSSLAAKSGSTRAVTKRVLPSWGALNSPTMYLSVIEMLLIFPSFSSFSNAL
jgi:hypothetical protein